MKTTQVIIRAAALVQLALGLAVWAGYAKNALTPVHMTVGMVLVLTLWVHAVLTARAGTPVPLAVVAGVWGLVVVALGVTQKSLLTGGAHWVIQVLHLLVGLVAIASAEIVGGRLRRQRLSTSTV